MKNYKELANTLRKQVLQMTFRAQSSHIGSNFSCADIMTVLYNNADFSLIPDGLTKDIIVVKSWAAANVYALLVSRGLLPQEAVDRYGEEGTQWKTILEPLPPYVPFGTGAMGYHLPAAVGFALAKKIKGESGTVYCLISDGELDIGSTWEAAQIAKQHKLNNLVCIVDKNGWQAMGKVDDILKVEPTALFYGWNGVACNGHDHQAILECLNVGGQDPEMPKLIVANTVKGKGVSFMENENTWHYAHVNKVALEDALKELE